MNQEHNDRGNNNDYQSPSLEDLAMASVFLPLAHGNLLDYLYASGLPLRPIQLGGAIDIGMEGIASILANSLYDSRPVKNVVDEKGMAQISEKIYTAQMAEELKINTVCGIWQDEFEEGEPIKILPCNHAFKSAAIEQWLTTEKAECPICRFSLSSKEVICHPISSDAGDDAAVADEQPADQDALQINENNIAARLVGNIQNNSHREDPVRAVYANAYASRQSISVPMNQLLQSRRNMIDNIARASGGSRVASRWPVSRNAPAPAAAVAAEPVIRHDDERPRYIHNYYFGNIINQPVINNNNNNNNNDYNPDVQDDRDAQAEEDNIINNRYNNNNQYNVYNNIHDINDNHISNRERDDIQEAIRRSLEEQ
jgi:hypothetical protein